MVEPIWSALLTAKPGSARDTTAEDPKQPVVDAVHFAAARKWKRNLLARDTRAEIAGLLGALKRQPYDAVVDFQGAVRSALSKAQ